VSTELLNNFTYLLTYFLLSWDWYISPLTGCCVSGL